MTKRSKVMTLPADVKAWLDQALVKGNFSGYKLLESALKEKGFDLSHAAIHRYGSQLERRLQAIKASTEAAAAIAAAAPDDEDLRSGAIISLIQTEVFEAIVTLQEADDADPVERVNILSKAAKNIASLSRASVGQKKWMLEMRDKVKAAADAAVKIGKKGGLSAGAVDEIRREILGIAT